MALLPYEHGRGRVVRAPTLAQPKTPLFGPLTSRVPGQTRRTLGASVLPRVAATASLLPPLAPPVLSATADATATGPPAGWGDLINSLLSGLGGAQQGMTPEEGLAGARRALIQYGGVPQGLSGLKYLGGAFDSGTQKLAEANTRSGISLLARMNEAHADQNRMIVNRLAARGLLDSGETGFQSAREQTNYARAQADAGAKLLDYLAGINSGIAQYNQWKAMMDAIANAMAQGGTPPDGTPPPAAPPAAPIIPVGPYLAGQGPFVQPPHPSTIPGIQGATYGRRRTSGYYVL